MSFPLSPSLVVRAVALAALLCGCSRRSVEPPTDANRPAATTTTAATTRSAPAAAAPFTPPHEAGTLAAPPKSETSGLAVSRRAFDLLWTHDDSGGAAALFAVGTDGRSRGQLELDGAKNHDWEDVASAELDGAAWLLVGDIGDNDAERSAVFVHFIAEPDPSRLEATPNVSASPAATLRLTYEDGPRDAESLAIDPAERALYVLTKRDKPPRLYRADLPPAPLRDADVTLRFVALVPHIPQPTPEQLRQKGHRGKNRARPCAIDFAADGSAAIVLTYGEPLFFPRQGKEPWAETLARPPLLLADHKLPQAEAVCFARDGGRVFVASESTRTLLRYDRK